jgi:energy-converting hydrogenase A subunit R
VWFGRGGGGGRRTGGGRRSGRGRLFATDLEGPVTKNDNALEVAEAVIPRGGQLFRRVSLYDDYLAEVVRREGYHAGDTLRLMLPFLLAHGLDMERMRELSAANILIVPGAEEVLRCVARLAPSYIVSTSYCPYVEAVCAAVGFPTDHAFCTQVDLAAQSMPADEIEQVRSMAETILRRPPIDIPPGADGPEALSEADRATVRELDYIFWVRVPGLRSCRIVDEVRCVGGPEKAQSLRQACDRERTTMRDLVYVGDSITDVEAFRLVHREGGLAVSFNGNRWAVKEADLAVVSDRADPILTIARDFLANGPDDVACRDWPLSGEGWSAHWVSRADLDDLVQMSEQRRRQVRGEAIGQLG